MTRKKYICAECGAIFNTELTKLIEKDIQVFCEKCGAPFNLEEGKFTEQEYKPVKHKKDKKQPSIQENKDKKKKKPKKNKELEEKDYSTLKSAIGVMNKFSYIPILIFSIISAILIIDAFMKPAQFFIIFIRNFTASAAGFSIALYDNRFISKRIKEDNHKEVILDGFGIGILGCIVFGLGVLILIKGILLMIYVFLTEKKQNSGFYEKGLLMKNSLCNFSSKAGYIIIVMAINGFYNGSIKVNEVPVLKYIRNLPDFTIVFPFLIAFSVFFLLALISLIINSLITHKIYYRQSFDTKHGIALIILGILGTMFYAAGIFVLFEGLLLIILRIISPEEYQAKPIIAKQEKTRKEFRGEQDFQKAEISLPSPREKSEIQKKEITEEQIEKIPQKEVEEKSGSKPPFVPETKAKEKPKEIMEEKKPFLKEKPSEKKVSKPPFIPQEEQKEISKEKKEEVQQEISKIKDEETERVKEEHKEEELDLKLHESLLPVKSKKDKKLVKEYFSKIFALLSKDIRKKIKQLDISKSEKKEILKELSFLSKEKQINYINAILYLYKEKIPEQLIQRIKNLKNLKPEHFEKLVNQLKYMDSQEQFQFIQFLEKHA
jgi:DNA-directed RNA polymerase subunit RPC12/RpoP